MDTAAEFRTHAAEFLVQAEREPEREAHLISIAPNPGYASPSTQSIYKSSRTTRGPLLSNIQT